ncbi:MAG: hydrogenase maturation protease [Chloroflexota bacterium]
MLVSVADPLGSVLAFGRETHTETPRILIGGVGYTCLRDGSFGAVLVDRLCQRSWPDGVLVEDLSYGPIDVLFRFQSTEPLDAAVFVGAVSRGRVPGRLYATERVDEARSADDLQVRVGEALTGVVSLDNLLAILQHFRALPERVLVLELEPVDTNWGEVMSEGASGCLDQAADLIAAYVCDQMQRGAAP